jgi:hypothetical protein
MMQIFVRIQRAESPGKEGQFVWNQVEAAALNKTKNCLKL